MLIDKHQWRKIIVEWLVIPDMPRDAENSLDLLLITVQSDADNAVKPTRFKSLDGDLLGSSIGLDLGEREIADAVLERLEGLSFVHHRTRVRVAIWTREGAIVRPRVWDWVPNFVRHVIRIVCRHDALR